MATDQNPQPSDQDSPYVVGIEGSRGGIDVVGLIVAVWGFLAGLFKGKVDANVKSALEGLRDGLATVGKAIVDAVAWLSGKIAAVLDAMKRFIARVFGPLFDVLVNIVTRAARILQLIFGPVIDFLDKVRFALMQFYNDVLKPILDIIGFFRSVLQILGAFNIEWAKKLDAKLAELEDFVLEPFLLVMGKINELSNWLNKIADLDGLLKRITLVRSVMRDARYIHQALLMWRFKAEDAGSIANRKKRLNEGTLRDVIHNTETVILTGDGPYGSFVREMSAQWRIELRDAGF